MGLHFIAWGGIGFLLLLTPFDSALTLWLFAHRIDGLTSFMAQSIFQGQSVGGGDCAAALYLAAAVTLFATRRGRSARQRELHLYARFMLAIGLLTGVLVHGVKLSWGRARPELVIDHAAAFSPWYRPGPFLAGMDRFSGSFPSGHTAAMMAFVALGYLVWHHTAGTRTYRWASGILIGGGLVSAVGMAITRSMLLQHWVTDGWASIAAGWFLIHYAFHSFYRIPQRRLNLAASHEPRCFVPQRMPWPLIILSGATCALWLIRFIFH